MRIALAVGAVFLGGCWGKLALTEDMDASPPPAVSTDREAPKPERALSCGVAPISRTDDYGVIDVSRLGCVCESNADCGRGAFCIQFPSLDEAHCSRAKDPCTLIQCRENGACVVADADPVQPACYR